MNNANGKKSSSKTDIYCEKCGIEETYSVQMVGKRGFAFKKESALVP
jgi:hypothetical protein